MSPRYWYRKEHSPLVDIIVCGEYSGKVKAMFNERGKKVKDVGPSAPVLVLGFNGAPQAGEKFREFDNEQDARAVAAYRGQINREQTNRASKRISLDEIGRRLALGSFKELNLIIKGDVDGSIEAMADSLQKLSIERIQVNILHQAVGQIVESDVLACFRFGCNHHRFPGSSFTGGKKTGREGRCRDQAILYHLRSDQRDQGSYRRYAWSPPRKRRSSARWKSAMSSRSARWVQSPDVLYWKEKCHVTTISVSYGMVS